MTDIYQILEDGRIVEIRMGRQFDREHAIWARDLSPQEKRIYLRLKSLGYSDKNIYHQLNHGMKEKACAGR